MPRRWNACAFLAFVALLPASAAAAPVLRVQVDQRGDFVAIGNTLGWDCGAGAPAPVVGSVPGGGMCGSNVGDTAPDVHWRSDDPGGTATASTTIAPAQARSTAVLALPGTATVTHAFLYWAGKSAGGVDDTVTFDKLDSGTLVATQTVTALPADQYSVMSNGDIIFQAVADVTPFVQAQGAGAYRTSGIDTVSFVDRSDETAFSAWTLVVLYSDPLEPPRNLVVFDGLDQVSGGQPASATLSGFLVPVAGYDAKLGVITYEGDAVLTGDQLRFGMTPLTMMDALSDAVSPQNNFFNATRSLLGAPVSTAGDLPQLTGTAASMGGYDLDVVDITDRVAPGQTSADIQATSNGDLYLLGAFVTSISTFKPDLSTSAKTVEDVDGGALLPGDQLRFVVEAVNSGNDNAVGVVMTDPLPDNVSFVPGSIEITAGANTGVKTDVAGDDQAEYDASTHTVVARLGAGADAATGGTLLVGETTTVEFVVTVNPEASGSIENQAFLDYQGELGSPPEQTPTDGNGSEPGAPPTEVIIDGCETDEDCPDPREPVCDTAPDPNECVQCLTDEHCDEPTPACDLSTRSCVECTTDEHCPGENSVCDTATNTCSCDPVPGGEVCGNDIDEDCDGALDDGCPCVGDECPSGSGGPDGIFAAGGGCGCTAPGRRSNAPLGLVALALALAALRRRRR